MKFDVIIIGGGLAGMTAGVALRKAGKRCLVVSEGLSLHETPRSEYLSLGGILMAGDSVLSGVWEGDVLKSVRTRNMEGTVLEADAYILCTGKFFSKGLVSSMDGIVEPVFGCDVIYDRDNWVSSDFFAPQPFERFGIATSEGRAVIGGKAAANLYAAGEVVAGDVDIIDSALEVCRRLI